MTTPVRTPGKYGRRAPKLAAALDLGPLLTGIIPAHPAAADYLAKLGGGWQMGGNNVAGDCVAVTWANVRRLVTTILTAKGYYPTQAQIWDIYKTQNPDFDPGGTAETNGPGSPADGGMVIQELLERLVAIGGPDGVKAVAFFKVNTQNAAEVRAAIAIFGYLWVGINVLACNEQEFSAGQPFDYEADSPVEGGHSVLSGGYGAEPVAAPAALRGDEKFITWAAETSFTDAFWEHDVEECWVVLWPEHLGTREFLQGIDQAQFAAAYRDLTGRELPPAVPLSLTAPDWGAWQEISRMVNAVWTGADKDVTGIVDWLRARGF